MSINPIKETRKNKCNKNKIKRFSLLLKKRKNVILFKKNGANETYLSTTSKALFKVFFIVNWHLKRYFFLKYMFFEM